MVIVRSRKYTAVRVEYADVGPTSHVKFPEELPQTFWDSAPDAGRHQPDPFS
jgi:hypothetical protein